MNTAHLFPIGQTFAAIDSTGYSMNYASRHYIRRIFGESKRKNYIKLSISLGIESQCIIAAKSRLGPKNDNIDFPSLASQSANLAKPSYIVADRGYDSEANHRLVREPGSKSMIQLRRAKARHRTHSERRCSGNAIIWYITRDQVETVNSVMKRLIGSSVHSRSLVPQCKEVCMMCKVYNVHRYLIISLVYRCFLQNYIINKFIYNSKQNINNEKIIEQFKEQANSFVRHTISNNHAHSWLCLCPQQATYTEIALPQSGQVWPGLNVDLLDSFNAADLRVTCAIPRACSQVYIVNDGRNFWLWSQSRSNIYYNTGNVGIGKTNPTQKLDVNGNVAANDVYLRSVGK